MVVRALALALVFVAAACVDGKTPDCTSVDSGCFPEDGGSTLTDAGDANNASDGPVADAPTSDAASDAAKD